MATRGNIVFASRFYIEDKELTEEDFMNVRPKSWFIKKSFSIYVHSDMYPSGAIADLQEFLNLDGAKHRAEDTSYLSAWFVGWKCLDMVPYTRRMGDRSFDYNQCTNPSLKEMKESKDFFGVGLLNDLSDWASYSYLIVPKTEETHEEALKGNRNYYQYTDYNSFDIYIYAGNFEIYLGKINSKDTLQEIQNEDWWY